MIVCRRTITITGTERLSDRQLKASVCIAWSSAVLGVRNEISEFVSTPIDCCWNINESKDESEQ